MGRPSLYLSLSLFFFFFFLCLFSSLLLLLGPRLRCGGARTRGCAATGGAGPLNAPAETPAPPLPPPPPPPPPPRGEPARRPRPISPSRAGPLRGARRRRRCAKTPPCARWSRGALLPRRSHMAIVVDAGAVRRRDAGANRAGTGCALARTRKRHANQKLGQKISVE